jgi:hypothetical protein
MAFRSVPRPSSPPGAKASTECPYHTPIQWSDVRCQRHSRQFSQAAAQRQRDRSTLGGTIAGPTRGEPRCPAGSFRLDLNHLRHGTRIFVHSLRRTDIIRINSHNASEHSPSDLGARARAQHPRRGLEATDTLSRSDINRSGDPSFVSGGRRSETSDTRHLITNDRLRAQRRTRT